MTAGEIESPAYLYFLDRYTGVVNLDLFGRPVIIIEQTFKKGLKPMAFKRYANVYKVYVTVKVIFHGDGGFIPTSIIWEDGREFVIDEILDIRKAASQKAGGIGMRYTCIVQGQVKCLYLEDDRWFVERKVPMG